MATILDVAKAAGVSTATVSHVINHTKHVSPDTVKKVSDAITKLGYHTNPIAKSLKSRRTNRLAFILSDVSSQFHSAVIRGVTDVANANRYNVSIYCCYSDQNKEWSYLEDARNNQFDGILLDTVVSTADIPLYAKRLKKLLLDNTDKIIPVVLLERDFSSAGLDSVFSDIYAGARCAVQHLIDEGCRQIAFITPPPNLDERIRAYHDVLRENGIPEDPSIIRTGNLSHVGGYQAMQSIITSGGKFDAVFASNDTSAVGALRALQDAGISVPDTVRLIGFDDIFFSRVFTPSMSSIHIHKAQMGREGTALLCGRLSHEVTGPARRIELPWELMIRRSTDPEYSSTVSIDGDW